MPIDPSRLHGEHMETSTATQTDDARRLSSDTSNMLFSISDSFTCLLNHYETVFLISTERHLSSLPEPSSTFLVVTSDWIAWQICKRKNYHSILLDSGLIGGGNDGFVADAMVRANDWVFVQQEDITAFKSVSLGSQIVRATTVFMTHYDRLSRALETIVKKYKPTTIVAFDYRSDFDAVDAQSRFSIVQNICSSYKITLDDRWAPIAIDDNALPMKAEALLSSKKISIKQCILSCILRLTGSSIDLVSRTIMRVRTKKKKVLVCVVNNIGEPLKAAYNNQNLTPIFLFQSQKKNLFQILDNLRKGIFFAHIPTARITSPDRERLKSIEDNLAIARKNASSEMEIALRRFIHEHFILSGKLEELAESVLSFETLLDRFMPDEILVDTVVNPPPRIFLELAEKRGIPTIYTWHSVMTPTTQRMDGLGGTGPGRKKLVSKIFTWGQANEQWCNLNCPDIPTIRVGTPIQNRYQLEKKNLKSSPKSKNILLLEYTIGSSDSVGIHGSRFEYFVNIVSFLEREGYKNIQFKLHPGRPRSEYYDRIRKMFNLKCSIHKSEPFSEMLSDADIVIGPAITGARFEALGAGKPYFAVALPPCSYDIDSLQSEPVYIGLDALKEAILSHEIGLGDDLLNYYCSSDDIPDPATKMWEALQA